jgi:hypothetical protein
VAFRFTDKEPSHDCLGLRPSSIGESNRNFVATPIGHSRSRIDRRYYSSIFAEHLNKVTIVSVGHLKPIGSRRQDLAGNLDRLAKREQRRLISVVCTHYREHDVERKH